MIEPKLHQAILKNRAMITTSQVVNLGFSKTLLTQYVQQGLLIRSAHGVYTLPDVLIDDMYTLMLRSDHIIFSHHSAQYLHGLSSRTPFQHMITVPSNTSLSLVIKQSVDYFYIDPSLHTLGMVVKKTNFGNSVRCYNIERTLCDLLRSRSRCDQESLLAAIKQYVLLKDKNLPLLSQYAKIFHVEGMLHRYLEVLL